MSLFSLDKGKPEVRSKLIRHFPVIRYVGHVRKAKHLATNRTTACKILPAVDPTSPLTKDMILDAMEAQKEEILLKLMAGLKIEGVVGIDMVRHEKQWK